MPIDDPDTLYLVHVEGIGLNGEPVLWTHDGAERILPGTSLESSWEFDFRYDDIPGPSLVPPDQNFDAQRVYAEPFEARSRSGQATIRFRAFDGVGARFLRRARTAIASTTEPLDRTETAIDLDTPNLDSKVVYIGHETIELGTETSQTYSPCERGHFRSQATPHRTGANVYDVVPVWAGRMVTLYTYHVDDDALVQRERYRTVEEDGQAIGMSGGTIAMPVRGASANRGHWQVNTDPQIVRPTPDDNGDFHACRVRQEGYPKFSPEVYAQSHIRKEDEDYSLITKWRTQDLYAINGYQGSFPDAGTEDSEPDAWVPYDGELTEVFTVPLDTAPLAQLTGVENADIAPRHPIAIDAAVCLSTVETSKDVDAFDIFQAPHFGLGLQWLFAGNIVGRVKDLIDEYPDRLIDEFVLAGDGEPIDWMSWSDKHLLQPLGFYRAITKDGKMTYQSIDLADVGDYSAVVGTPIEAKTAPGDAPGPLDFETGRGHISDTVEVIYRDLPWQTPARQLVQAVEADSPRTASLQSRSDATLNLGAIQSESAVTRQGVAQLLFQHYQMPRLTIRVHDWRETGADYGIGERVALKDLPLEDEYLYDRDGTRIAAITDDPRFVGTILSRTPHYGGDAITYRLTLLLTNFAHQLTRWRAPSARVSGYASNRVVLPDSTDFGDVQADPSRFTVGDDVAAWSIDGVQQGGVAEIISISGGSGSDWAFDLNADISAQAGDYLRLARYNDYANAGVLPGVDRAYVYLGDSARDAQISGDVEADIYG